MNLHVNWPIQFAEVYISDSISLQRVFCLGLVWFEPEDSGDWSIFYQTDFQIYDQTAAS